MRFNKKDNLLKKTLPSDFDGGDYLDLNPDVREANMDPSKHYTNFGWRENRIYKKPFSIRLKDEKHDFQIRKSVVIHIGMGRCGTSSLQIALHSCRESFCKARVLYPKTLDGHIAHHVLAPHLPGEVPEACQHWLSILKEFESGEYEILLLSSEMFAECPDALLEYICLLLKKYEVKIFFFGKSQKKLLPSIYSQWSSVGVGFRSFRSFYNLTKNEWNLARTLRRWSDHFGVNNICCQILRDGDDSLQIFANLFSENTIYHLKTQDVSFRFNESLPRLELNFLKLFDVLSNPFAFYSTFPGWDRIEQDVRDRNTWLRSRLVRFFQYTSKAFPRRSRPLLSS